MGLEEIERLKEKIDKDPNSKLFVPLAEEYKKLGMYDEAIDALSKGLERQPNYLSARVSLGKIFSERSMLNEAVAEFEKVIASIPDNLYAHKKLAEIYKEIGEQDKAIKECKTVLKLNPMDEWAATSLVEIEGKGEPVREKPFIKEAKEEIIQEPPEPTEEPGPSHISVGFKPEGEEILSLEHALEEENEEKAVPFGEMPIMHDEITATGEQPQEISDQPEEETGEFPITEEFGRSHDFLSGQEEITETDQKEPEGLPSIDKETDLWSLESDLTEEQETEEEPGEISISEEDLDLWKSYKETEELTTEVPLDTEEHLPEEDLTAEPLDIEEHIPGEDLTAESLGIEEQAPEEASTFEDLWADEEFPAVVETVSIDKKTTIQPQTPNVRDADQFILQGKYPEAIKIYSEALSLDPGNRQIIQRIEELKSLLKLLGKDKEELITKLTSFLNGIRKKRDEFFRSS